MRLSRDRKDFHISTQLKDNDSLSSDKESKYQAFKPYFKLRTNGVLAFLRGKWLKTAFLLRSRPVAIFVLSIFMIFGIFNKGFAAPESNTVAFLSSSTGLGWMKSQIMDRISGGEDKDEKEAQPSSLLVANDSYIIKISPPDAEISTAEPKKDPYSMYAVKSGDTLTKISSDFGISLNTLLWANGLNGKSTIQIGQELKILPIDGIIYVVKKGDTLFGLSQKFKADADQIIDFNDLPADGSLKVGAQLVVPGGVMTAYEPITIKKIATSAVKSQAPTATKQAINAAMVAAEKMFIIPVSGIITQGKHSYTPPAIDIGNSCGTPIFAAADGTITVVRQTSSRYSLAEGGYGNNIRILHSDGSLSIYAHLLYGSILVNEGDTVSQGQKIAEIGGGWVKRGVRMAGAGRSTGCHLHFEVRNGANPFTKYRKGVVVKTPAANLAIDASNSGAGDSGDDSGDNQGTGFSGVISAPYKGN